MSYKVSLKQFEGPLDLLLHLIEKAEVDIKDIFVSEITSQYIDFIRQLDEYDMENSSEFVTMAATLLFIKSRSVVPQRQDELDEDFEDPEYLLIERIREYKAIKQATQKLNELKELNEGRFTKLREEFALPPQEYIIANTSVDLLYSAFSQILQRNSDEPYEEYTHEVDPDKYTVRSQLKRIREKLKDVLYISFFELFDDRATKLEMIVTFMALLDMIVRNEIYVRQSDPFGEIKIIVRSLLTSDEDAKYMDEDID